MADLRENQLGTITPNLVRCLTSAGNSGMVTPIGLLRYMYNNSGGLAGDDLNNAIETGIYIATFDTENAPVKDYGVVEVIRINIYVVQKFYALNEIGIYVRTAHDTKTFKAWTKLN